MENLKIAGNPLKTQFSSRVMEYYNRKKQETRSFNASQLARDIGVSPAYIHFILKGKKIPTLERTFSLSEALNLSSFEREELFDLVIMANAKLHSDELAQALQRGSYDDIYVEYDMQAVAQIKDWYHFAILDLVSCENFVPKVEHVAERLNLPMLTASAAVDRLFRYGFLVNENGRWVKRQRNISLQAREATRLARGIQKQMIEKAQEEMQRSDQSSFEKRKITGMTMAIDPERIEEAKKEIEHFKRKIGQYLTNGENSEVYQLNIQFFPLTGSRKDG